ncbi:nucleoside recognition domain-containing protein [Hwanghaeella sp.]|uniref:nucleoside recognition domain-containing protein n=1 Tax=Hwanghaeella sp. TaxID=2605943 RepID=UPI003CCC1310
MNAIFFAIVLIAFSVAAFRQITWVAETPEDVSPMDALGIGMIDTAEASVTLAIGLVGVMALFLGLMKVAEHGGLLVIIAKLLRPLMKRLFPDVPADHPAMGAMILNMSANVMGLGNAATPFGIRAMQELDKLNTQKGTATNAMALFLAINTSSVTLLPTGVIAIRAAAGSDDPAGIVPTTLVATICSTTVAIIMAKLLQRYWAASSPALPDVGASDGVETAPEEAATDAPDEARDLSKADDSYSATASIIALLCLFALVPLTVVYGKEIAPWIIPGLMISLLAFGVAKKVPVYESFVEGAKDGFNVALRIIPYLVAILVAVGMFRNSGAMDLLIIPLSAITGPLGLPAEALPMALLRPLSGSGAYGIMASIINDQAIGPDSYTGYLVSTLQGSTETTFYVLAVYFGAVQIKRIRHALAAALSADLAGIVAAVVICSILYGSLA